MQYETYISKELVASIDKNYNTIPDKKHRAITGYSMGGHGALYLAFKHNDIWGVAASMSGGLDIRGFQLQWEMAKRLGVYAENPENWEQNTVINLVHLLDGKNLKFLFDCGVDDFFLRC
jgi:S-formylglutathione hydrolase FrmB